MQSYVVSDDFVSKTLFYSVAIKYISPKKTPRNNQKRGFYGY
jgi:hypothetical protein